MLDKESIERQAAKELKDEKIREEVEKVKAKMRRKRMSLVDRIFPFKIIWRGFKK